MSDLSVQYRNATPDDVPGITDLSGQLGYPVSENRVARNLDLMIPTGDHLVRVACGPDGGIVAWIHVFRALRIESGQFAEIGGLIVSEAFRGRGIGRKLLASAESWAREMQLPKLRVRSQVQRQDARRFYTRMGFAVSKEQRVFDKQMERG